MSVKEAKNKNLVETVEGLRKIVQACFGSLTKMKERVSKLEQNMEQEIKKNQEPICKCKCETEPVALKENLASIEERMETIEFHVENNVNSELDKEIEKLHYKCMSNKQNIDDVIVTINDLEKEQTKVIETGKCSNKKAEATIAEVNEIKQLLNDQSKVSDSWIYCKKYTKINKNKMQKL